MSNGFIKQIKTSTGTYDVGVYDNSNSTAVLPTGSTAYLEINTKPNLTISSPAMTSAGKGGKINIEAADDIQLKPGDDLALITSHKPVITDQNEFKMMVTDGNDVPVHFKIQASEVTFLTDYYASAGQTRIGDTNPIVAADTQILNMYMRANTSDVAQTNKLDELAYLKVRARAIDLRCEEHGGISLQPFGSDSDGHLNKIKFEHGGGDGLEFLTINNDKTSIYTGEYRFNKHALVKMATRTPQASEKFAKATDDTQKLQYPKQTDDFSDVVAESFNIVNGEKVGDEQATWQDIIKTSYAFNGDMGVKTGISKKGNFQIETPFTQFYWSAPSETEATKITSGKITPLTQTDLGIYFTLNTDATTTDLNYQNIVLTNSEKVYSVNDTSISLTPGELEAALNTKKHDAVNLLNDLIGIKYITSAEKIVADSATTISAATATTVETDVKYIIFYYDSTAGKYVWDSKKKSTITSKYTTVTDFTGTISNATIPAPTTKTELDAALTKAYLCPTDVATTVYNVTYTPAGNLILRGVEDNSRHINLESGSTIKLETNHIEVIGNSDVKVTSSGNTIISSPTITFTDGTNSITLAELLTLKSDVETLKAKA